LLVLKLPAFFADRVVLPEDPKRKILNFFIQPGRL
jgi:hypothetical protein